jgi:hypothetical protein
MVAHCRWPSFARFLDDGRICLFNNAAERALRGFALGRRSWLFAGSERGGDRAAAIATLIMSRRSCTKRTSVSSSYPSLEGRGEVRGIGVHVAANRLP